MNTELIEKLELLKYFASKLAKTDPKMARLAEGASILIEIEKDTLDTKKDTQKLDN